jgi:hypothetical protein
VVLLFGLAWGGTAKLVGQPWSQTLARIEETFADGACRNL